MSELLLSLLREHDLSPRSLYSVVGALQDDFCSAIVAFLRGAALCISVRHSFSPQVVHVLNDLLYEGFVNDTVSLDGGMTDRGVYLSRLLLKAAQEFGSEPLLYLGLGAMRAIGLSASPSISHQVTMTLVKAERRKLDWALKVSKGKVLNLLQKEDGDV
ncbi:hypothetical protein STCU_02238 [Strigomonas culicis]|uniref:Uncharacterized protein n=1 Tax=Strigomonas culicis TaxID=28005 RepID=S9UX94_9TRYP|nr:hypothetical protein STCU_02238 [Strigomonas culicis]|eukprot:EPY33399.1 hypothetical protein STCU_02238 [Strigomonas culicis]